MEQARIAPKDLPSQTGRAAKGAYRAVLLLIVLTVTHCQTLDQMSRIYLNATPEGRDLLRRYEHYAEIADKLKRYHDDGVLDSAEVLEVLADAGVIAPLPGPGGSPSPAPSPSPTPGTGLVPSRPP